MKLNQIFNEAYLRQRAEQTIRDTLKSLDGQERKDFAESMLRELESNKIPFTPVIDELYTAAYLA